VGFGSSLFTMKESVVDDWQWCKMSLNLPANSKVLILGAYKGRDASKFNGATVYAVEPSNMAFRRLVKKAKNKDIIPLKLAVGEKNGLSTFHEYGYPFFWQGKGNSLFERGQKCDFLRNLVRNRPLWFKREYKVLTVDLKTLLSLLELKFVDLLVCDIEGAERYIIDQITELADCFGQVDMELHPQIYGRLLNSDLIDKMARFFNFVTNKTNHILFER